MKSLKYSLPVLITIFVILLFQNISLEAAGIPESVTSPGGISLNNLEEYPVSIATQTDSEFNYDRIPSVAEFNDSYNFRQWYFKAMHVPVLQLSSLSMSEVMVAVLDTGIDKNHEDLQDRVPVEIDFTNGFSPNDINGHGTHIAGIIAANSNNLIGISGLAANVKLMNVKVADDSGTCKADIVAKGIFWAAENGAQIINLSVEFNDPYKELNDAVEYAWQKGCIVIASASNHTTQPVFPASYNNCLAVTNTNENNQTEVLAYNGEWIDIAAPGFRIYSTLPNNDYGFKSGTSFATAQVSGLAAILYGLAIKQHYGGQLNNEIKNIILSGAQNISPDGIKRIDFMNSISILLSKQ
jgi:subtilisin family serine protease